jgi:hypothetical protein
MIKKILAFQNNGISNYLNKEMLMSLYSPNIPFLKLTSASDPLSQDHEFSLNDNGDKLVVTQTITDVFDGVSETRKFSASFHKKTTSDWIISKGISEIVMTDDFDSNCFISTVVTKKHWYQKGLASFLLRGLINSYDSVCIGAKFELSDMSTVLINKTNEPFFGAFIYIKPAIEAGYAVKITVSGLNKNTERITFVPRYILQKPEHNLDETRSYLMSLEEIDYEINAVMNSFSQRVDFNIFSNDRNIFNETALLNCRIG